MSFTGSETQDWVLGVLGGLGVRSPADQTITAMQLWAASEGMPDWCFNWLATTKGGYGGSTINSAGVYAYPSFAKGVAATVATIRQSNMQPIYDAITMGGLILPIYQAINASPWCAGCQGGRYPVALADYLQAAVVPGSITPAQQGSVPPTWDWSARVHDAATRTEAHCRATNATVRALRGL